MDDHALLREFAENGKREALAELTGRYEPLVRGAALRETGDGHLAEDIVQSTMLVLMRKAGTIRQGKPVGPWLLKVAHDLAIDALRGETARRRHERLAAAQRTEVLENARGTVTQSIEPVLDRALNALSEKDRVILVLRYLQGWSFEQIAGELGLTLDATRQRLSRALRRLRNQLDGDGVKRDDLLVAVFLPLVEEFKRGLFAEGLPRGWRRVRRPRLLVFAGAGIVVVGGMALAYLSYHRPTRSTMQPVIQLPQGNGPAANRPQSTVP
jgi:RNA polymerase sigma factor (sigma-70 family)